MFAALGLIGSNVLVAFGQTSVRTLFALTSAKYHIAYYPVFFLCLMCFTIVEIARYGANFFQTIGMKDCKTAKILAEIRWNSFLVCYPLGGSLESVMHLEAVPALRSMNPMPLSITMPNAANFAFNFSYVLLLMPLLVAFGLPKNYMYLLGKRKQYYQQKREEKQPQAKQET